MDNAITGAREILEEHRQLHHELEELGVFVALPGADLGPWLATLAAWLERVHPTLDRHFAREVKIGLFSDIEQAFPNAATACEELKREHSVFLQQLAEIAAAAKDGPADVAHATDLARRTTRVLQDLRRHERRENDLLYVALEGGPPAGD